MDKLKKLLIGLFVLLLVPGCAKSVSQCKSLSDEREGYRCFAGFLTNISQCEKSADSIFEKNGAVLYSYHFCDSVFAIKQNDYRLCDGNGFSRDGAYAPGICLGELAFFLDNASICDNALKLHTDDNLEEKELCLQKFAIHKGNYEICNRITGKTMNNECVAGVAIEKKDRKRCEEIQDEAFKEHCLIYISYG